MIKLFRKIRQRLLTENKFSKYLIYAGGEILLVMVGILLALQVNNWNESRKQEIKELALLSELKADLVFSLQEIDTVTYDNGLYVKDYKKIKRHIIGDYSYHVVLDEAFGSLDIWSEPYLPNMAYEAIKVTGLDIISNDSLKRHISKVHNFSIKMLMEDMIKWEWSFNQNTTQHFMVKYIRREPGNGLARPVDFEAIKADDEFLNFLNILIAVRSDNVQISKSTSNAIKKLIQHIDQELQNRS